MKIISTIFVILFLALLGVGYYLWQGNSYSKEILKLEIIAPEEVDAGEEFEYLVKIKNNGKVRLEEAELSFEAPEKSLLTDYDEKRIHQSIEDIYPGEERTYSFKARVFGKVSDTFEAKTTVSYTPKNLKAGYESNTSLTNRINFVPLTLEFDIPAKVESGDPIDFTVNYFSNIDYLLENMRVRVDYPQGFDFLDSSPKSLESVEWLVPSLYRASGGRVEIKGLLEGDEGEEKVFRSQLGIVVDDEFWPIQETSESIRIVESSLFISSQINNSQMYSADSGELLHYEIFFKNIGKKTIQKKFLFVKLDGDFFDLESLKSDKGEFGTGDNSIIWDWKNIPSLRFLDVGEEGKIEFWVKLKEGIKGKIKNPSVEVSVNIGGIEKVFETKLKSNVEFSQKAFFSMQDFFDNTGSVPPEVGKPTKYTVMWQIKNDWNDLDNVKVRGTLPDNVSFTGEMFPEDAKLTYDSDSHEILWNAESIESWGGEEELKTVAFQIELNPLRSQVGDPAILVEEAMIIADDIWTEETIEKEIDQIDTTLPFDKDLEEDEGIVID